MRILTKLRRNILIAFLALCAIVCFTIPFLLVAPMAEHTQVVENQTTTESAPTAIILHENAEKSIIPLQENGNETLVSVVRGTNEYFGTWQILAPESNKWVNIFGKTQDSLVVNYSLVASMLNAQDKAYLRYAFENDSGFYASKSVEIALSYQVEDDENILETYTSPKKVALKATSQDETFQTVSIVINYLFDKGGLAFEPYGASIATGSDFYAVINSPSIAGYAPFVLRDGEYVDATTVVLDYKNLQANQTVNVLYKPTIVGFQIHHHLQNLLDDGYSLQADYITTGKGLTNDLIPDNLAFTEDEMPGFKALAYEKLEIAADGSTVVEIRYDRNYYLIDFDMLGGYGSEPVYVRYGTTVGVNAPTRHGYLFDGWELISIAGKTPTAQQSANLDINAGFIIAPAGNLVYRARWITQLTNYTMVFWGENAEDNKFTYWGHLDGLTAMSGDYISGSDRVDEATDVPFREQFAYCDVLTDKDVLIEGDGSSIINVYYTRNRYTITFKATAACTIPQSHTHGDSCYITLCNMAHVHDENCHAQLSCSINEHTQHTADCLICNTNEHAHSSACCNLTEHTHSTSCWNNVGAASTPSNAPSNSNVVDGYVYRPNGFGNRTYYIYIKGTWYRYTGSNASNGRIIAATCGYSEHTHGTSGCQCTQTVHKHSASCYKDVLHTHDDDCYTYSCGVTEHQHTNACYLLNCGIPENHKHSSTCTSTKSSNTVKIVYKKFQESLHDIWPIVDDNGVSYNSGERWKPSGSDTYSQVLVYISNMPGESFTLTSDPSTNDTFTMYYYMEVLPEQSYDKTLDGKNFRLENTIKARYNYLTEAEDFFEIPGFTKYKSSPTFKDGQLDIDGGGEVYLYYSRTVTNVLEFRNNGQILQDKRITGVMYGASLSAYNFTPDYPTALEPNAYFFDGWYTTPGHYDGTEVNWSKATMEAGDMMYYAKWSPVLHEINVYLTSDLTQKIGDTQYVKHNNLAVAPSQTISNGNYIFQGWFYMETVDGVTTEKAFVFSGIPIKKDLNIYAKWSSHVSVGYSIKYVLKLTQEEIADPTVGSSIAGHNKTFYAKAGDELYAGYQTGYYPLTSSHTVTMSAESNHEYVFEYVFVESMPYSVRYLDENNNPVAPEKKVMDNNLSVVTETFVQVPEMMPDAYQKRLVLTASGKDTNDDGIYEENVIIFRYTSDPEHAYYKVVHYIENVSADGYREYRSEDVVGVIGKTYTISAISLTGFTFNPTKTTVNDVSATATNGSVSAVLTSDGLIFKLYYDRNDVSYIVRYLESGTGTVLHTEKSGEGIFGAQIVEYAVGLSHLGYELVSENVKTISLSMNESLNVIEFQYQEANYAIRYQVVGLSGSATLSIFSENVKAVTGVANGSRPMIASGYHYVGWYYDEACTRPVLAEWIDSTYKITPQKDGVWENNVTYYIKIDPNLTSLTISTVGAAATDMQMFLFRVQGISGEAIGVDIVVTVVGNSSTTISKLPIGTYVITENTAWSFRYQPDEASKTIALGVDVTKNVVKFSHVRSADKWLDGNDSASGKFNR